MKNTRFLFGILISLSVSAHAAVVTIPTLKTSSVATTTFKLSTTLIAPFVKGNRINIDYGKGLKAMTCVELNCTLSSNIVPLGESVDYKIGIYNSKKALQGGVQTGKYSVSGMTTTYDTVDNTPVSHVGIASTMVKFTANLSAPLIKNYSVKVDYGKGLKAMTCSGKTCVLSSNTLPDGVSATYKIGMYKGSMLQDETINGSYSLASPPPPITQASYTKISNSGTALEDTATQGTGDTDWACTKDNKTGLIWEVKTTDRGLHDASSIYSWYEPNAAQNSGNAGKQNGGYCRESRCDTYAYKNAVNAKKLCGAQNWRLPTRNELMSLVYCSDNKYTVLGDKLTGHICTNFDSVDGPTINVTYFPNIPKDYLVWTSTQDTKSNSYALIVHFSVGYVDDYGKFFSNRVFLVHR